MRKKAVFLLLFLAMTLFLGKKSVAEDKTIKFETFTPTPWQTPTPSPTPFFKPTSTMTPTLTPTPTQPPSISCTLPSYYGYLDQYGNPFELAFEALKRSYFKDHAAASEKEADSWACSEIWNYWKAAEDVFIAAGKDPETYHQYMAHFAKGMARCSAHLGYSVEELKNLLLAMSFEDAREFLAHYIISPLYLYPPKQTTVSVKVSGEIVFSDPKAETNSWKVLANPSGKFIDLTDQKEYQNLAFDLKIEKFKVPQRGVITERENLQEILAVYANKFRLNQKETRDFVDYWLKKMPIANFYFVSHFSTDEAEELMPLKISPQPDTEIKLMMYFKPLVERPREEISPPEFPLIPARVGFTTFDFNGIIDW